jgi:sec-independent protein translocase protein TatA
MAPTWFKLVLVVFLVVVLFGRGRISDLMGDLASGIKSFKRGLSDDETAATAPLPEDAPAQLDARAGLRAR